MSCICVGLFCFVLCTTINIYILCETKIVTMTSLDEEEIRLPYVMVELRLVPGYIHER